MMSIPKPVFCVFLLLFSQAATAEPFRDCTSIEIQNNFETEACRLLSLPSIESAFNNIEENHGLSIAQLIELTEIPAPPFKEEKRASRFAEMLEETGFGEVYIDEVGNVISRRHGQTGNKVIAVGAHIDTVFPMQSGIKVKQEENVFRAPGIGDNTRGVILLLELARAIVAADIETDADILLIGNVGEEGLGDLRGVRHLFREGAERIDTFIAIDGGRPNRLVYGGVGSLRYRVTFRGSGGHSWGAFGLGNPHHALGRAIDKFVNDAAMVIETGDKTTYNIGRIGGGTSINSIPFASWMEVDLRSGDPKKLAEIDDALKASVAHALETENNSRTRGPELSVEVKPVGNRPAGKGDVQSPLVQQTIAAMEILGLAPDLRISSTDANIPISLGIPAITLSRGGRTRGAHSLTESWTDEEASLSAQLALVVLMAEAGLAESP